MSIHRQEKADAVNDLSERLSRAKAALVADFTGLNVAAVTEIRRALRAVAVDYRVVKNTLMKRALSGTKRAAISDAFTGPTAVAFKYDDEVGKLGKVARELTKKFEKFKIKAGFVEDDVLPGPNSVETLASLPTLDEARAQLLGVVNAPAAKLLAQINAPASNVIGVVKAKQEKDEKGAAPA